MKSSKALEKTLPSFVCKIHQTASERTVGVLWHKWLLISQAHWIIISIALLLQHLQWSPYGTYKILRYEIQVSASKVLN